VTTDTSLEQSQTSQTTYRDPRIGTEEAESSRDADKADRHASEPGQQPVEPV
jgi:hypothetical protein